jgi:hypothetical protein
MEERFYSFDLKLTLVNSSCINDKFECLSIVTTSSKQRSNYQVTVELIKEGILSQLTS